VKLALRKALASLAAVGVLAPLVGTANADDISNNVDDSLDAVAEVMPLNVGGAPGTTQLYVVARNGDGKPGCNFTAGTSLTVAINSSDTSVATVSPPSTTFNSCGDTKTVTVNPVAPGTANITLQQSSNTTSGTFNLAPATFTVNVAGPANTAPTVRVGGVSAGTLYNKGSVLAATCQVTDAEDGPSSFAATLSPITGQYASDGIGSQTASCSYTDAGGLYAEASATYNIIDPSAPGIGSTLNPVSPDGHNGWYKSDVALTWTVTEEESPNSLIKTGCVDQTVIADQAATIYSCEAISAGGSAGPVSVTIKRDATAPTVNLVGGPADGATYYVGLDTIPAAPTCSADDATSGVADCTVTGYSTSRGTHTVTATATDNAGNSADSASISYTVAGLTVDGFFNPVNMGVLNTVKGGNTVPLKFKVFAGSTELTATSVVQSFKTVKTPCDAALTDDVEFTTTGGTSLRYDSTGSQFIQNWATPKAPGTCVRVNLTLIDGQVVSADFKLR
jgi:hypothetical protein